VALSYPLLTPLPGWPVPDRFRPVDAVAAAGDLPIVLTRVGRENPAVAEGVTAFLEFPGQPDVVGACRRLAEEHKVLLVPGECFGDAYRAYARLGFGGTRTELTEGLRRLEIVLRESHTGG